MAELQRYRLEALNARHAIANFTCETDELNDYIREEALFDMARNVARTFVEIDNEKPVTNNVAGFFTLRADALRIDETYFDDWIAPDDGGATHFDPIQVPLIELMCLARDLQWERHGLGDILMIDTLKMVAAAASSVGLIGLHLRSTNRGVALYKAYEFQPFKEHPSYDSMRYILPINLLKAIVQIAVQGEQT